MTTNKPEVVAYATRHDEPMLFPGKREAAAYCDDEEEPMSLIRLSDYEALKAECEHLKAGVAGLSNPETVLVNMLRGTVAIPDIRSWSKLFGEVLNDEDERMLEIARLRSECEKLRGLLAEIGRGCSRRDMPSEQTIASWAEDIDAATKENPK